jgi:hypothetical protein
MRKQQRGMTMIGFIIIGAMVAIIGYGAVRLLPVYMTQFKIQKMLNDVRSEFEGTSPSAAQIRAALGKRLDVEMVYYPTAKDFTVKKAGGVVTVGINYEDRVPFFGNIFLGAEFDNQVEINP